MDLQTATPAEIDTILADLYGQESALLSRLAQAADSVHYTAKSERRFRGGWNRPIAAALADLADRAADATHPWDRRAAQDSLDRHAAAAAAVEANRAEQAPFHAEFERRGGWTRAFLVLASNGHVHKSMSCTTCYATTRYGWLPQVSGLDEAQIVAQAGTDACTVCYPSAPVATAGARTLLHATEVEAQNARDERAAKRAAAAARKAAKALYPEDAEHGIRVNRYDVVKTLAAARSYLTDGYAWGWDHPDYTVEARERVAAQVAVREDKTAEQVLAEAAKRAAKRR